jgi:hypothetical protein
MVKHYLEFEKPLIELEREIENLKRFSIGKQISFSEPLKIWRKNFTVCKKKYF